MRRLPLFQATGFCIHQFATVAVMQQLFMVAGAFTVPGRGLVLIPDVRPEQRVKVGDAILLRRCGATDLSAEVAGVEVPLPNPQREVLILVRELTNEQVPVGTEVWSVDE